MPVQRIVFEGTRTWTVTGEDHLSAGPVEEFLDHLRVARQASPNTIRSYATSLDRWWRYLPAVPASPGPSQADAGVADALTVKLREERAARLAAARDLEERLAATHGELLRLRWVLEQHGIQA